MISPIIKPFAAAGLGIVIFALCLWQSYSMGFNTAEAIGAKNIAELQESYAAQYANAVMALNTRLQQETTNILAVASTIAKEKLTNAQTAHALEKQIATITRASTHTFSAEFVGLWNKAVSLGSAMPSTSNTATVNGKTATSAPTSTRLLAGHVTEADILEYIVYFGKRSKDLEAQVNGWIQLAKRNGWKIEGNE